MDGRGKKGLGYDGAGHRGSQTEPRGGEWGKREVSDRDPGWGTGKDLTVKGY